MTLDVRVPQWSRKASLQIGETPLEGVPDLAWLPWFPDFARAAARTPQYQPAAANIFPIPALLSWHPTFDDFARAKARTVEYQAYAANIFPIPALLSWHPTFDDFARAAARAAEYPFIAFNPSRDVPEVNLVWHPTFDDFARAAARTVEYQFIARPIAPVIQTGAAVIVIHTPDEIPVGAETRFSVEYDVSGVPVAFDVPPDLRIYHLDLVTGLQITDLAAAPMTQYGLAPAYHRSWTPGAKGVYILEVQGSYLLVNVIAVLPVTVRPKFDPIGLAIDDVLVARNGDVPT